jgi:hypothetical protein
MNNENTSLETQSIPAVVEPNYSKFKKIFKKSIQLLKPTVLNVSVTFVLFLIILAVSKILGISILVGVSGYLFTSFGLQPLIKQKFGKNLKIISFKKESTKAELIPTKNDSVLLYKRKKILIAITLLQIEWFGGFIPLNQIWDHLLREGVQIQDCREGCFLIIRKKITINASNGLQDEANKLVKEITRTIKLIKKKIEIEYDDINLRLIKNQELIQTILFLGLAPDKFTSYPEWSSDDYNYLKNGSLQTSIEILEEKTNY